jgi:hypothetical protein
MQPAILWRSRLDTGQRLDSWVVMGYIEIESADSSEVQDKLKGVQKDQATAGAFAAIPALGSEISLLG